MKFMKVDLRKNSIRKGSVVSHFVPFSHFQKNAMSFPLHQEGARLVQRVQSAEGIVTIQWQSLGFVS